ncbi:hypothetical protein EYR40_008235 [Pleurotus pulmonarius]|nr:hypothetical protein EYR36_009058 [Pleurotus pulmonarius]KAF4597770.1 hypothetical protein EYR40_008235 [Pleurotus pulmonarius]
MPEIRECIAHHIHFQHVFSKLNAENTNFRLLNLWADAKDGKEGKPSDEERKYHATDGKVMCLDSSCCIKRGTNRRQTPIWPPQCKPKGKGAMPEVVLSSLELKGAQGTARTIHLDFGVLWISIAYLTHMSLQFYTKDMWYNSILTVPKKLRGFRVGLAFEFETHTLAFVTLDNVFQPNWAVSCDRLPPTPSDVYADFHGFLCGVSSFVEGVLDSRKACLAADGMRTSTTRVFFGMGVYTLCEVFFMAGIPIHISIQDFCQSPSRVARLCLALWEYTRKSHDNLWSDILKPAMVDNILAPTRRQREQYSDWLMVYGKSRTLLPRRMAELIVKHETNDVNGEGDIFEPGYLNIALQEHPYLGSLVFGESAWTHLGGSVGGGDPLSSLFDKRSMLDAKSHINPEYYESIVPYDFMDKTRPRKQTYLYYQAHKTCGKQLWTIAKIPSSHAETFDLITGTERETRLFSNIVKKSASVAIGPLEYCGNGRIMMTTHQKKRVFVVQGDPSLSDTDFKRYIRGIYRIKNHLDEPGQPKTGMSKEHQTELNKWITSLEVVRRRGLSGPEYDMEETEDTFKGSDEAANDDDDQQTVGPSSDDTLVGDEDEDDDQPPTKKRRLSINQPPMKKQRLSADARLSLTSGKENTIPPLFGIRVTRRSKKP